MNFNDNSSLVASTPLVQSSGVSYIKNKVVEMPVRGLVLEYLKLLHDDASFDFNAHSNVVIDIGYGGYTIEEIRNKWITTKLTLKAIIDKIHLEGKTVGIPVIGWIQGEGNNRDFDFGENYYNELDAYFNDVSDFVIENADNINRPNFLLYQTNGYEAFTIADKRLNIALKQLELAEKRPDVFLTSPMYMYAFNTDCTHVQFFGSRNAGANMGVFAKKLAIDGEKPKFLHVLKHSVYQSGAGEWTILLQCEVPVAPLVIDPKFIQSHTVDKTWSVLTANGLASTTIDNCGFELFNHDWTQEVDTDVIRPNQTTQYWTAPKLVNWNKQNIITDVEIINETNIKITCSADPTGLELWYARRGCQGGGYIHDSQIATLNADGYGQNNFVWNWMPVFMRVL
jgi:hypothetical protein